MTSPLAEQLGPAQLTTSLLLEAVPSAAGHARGAVTEALARWGLHHLTEDATAIATELVSNAVAACVEAPLPAGMPMAVSIWLNAERGELTIRAWDPDPTPPPRDYQPEPDDEHGRGLMIVNALSHRWGCTPAPGGGKYVWSRLRTDA